MKIQINSHKQGGSMEKTYCEDCEKDFEYSEEDEYYSCDIIEGQYTEMLAVLCPHC